MSAVFEHNDVRFIYPENWSLSQDDNKDECPWEVSLETPNGGLWSVHIFPYNADPKQLLTDTREAWSNQYEDVEFADILEEICGCQSIGIDAFFYCLDFLVTAKTRIITTDRYKLVLCYQAENREFDSIQEVFQAITTSLLENMVTP